MKVYHHATISLLKWGLSRVHLFFFLRKNEKPCYHQGLERFRLEFRWNYLEVWQEICDNFCDNVRQFQGILRQFLRQFFSDLKRRYSGFISLFSVRRWRRFTTHFGSLALSNPTCLHFSMWMSTAFRAGAGRIYSDLLGFAQRRLLRSNTR